MLNESYKLASASKNKHIEDFRSVSGGEYGRRGARYIRQKVTQVCYGDLNEYRNLLESKMTKSKIRMCTLRMNE